MEVTGLRRALRDPKSTTQQTKVTKKTDQIKPFVWFVRFVVSSFPNFAGDMPRPIGARSAAYENLRAFLVKTSSH